MKISELGEFGLISLIQSISDKFRDPEQASWQQLLIGIGDDVAAWQGDNHVQLATTDTLVQDVHFDLDIITWEELGWKALAVNLSDIAAMGGVPRYALVSLACPGEIEVASISRLCHSMAGLAADFGVAIVGGNLASALNLVITITMLGRSKNKSMLKRSAAMPGEQIAVTGHLGSSAAGLEMLKKKISFDAETTNILRKAHLKPMPKVKEGQILIEQGVNSAIDISDGLIADLEHICEASKVNARIDIAQLPIHPLVKANFPGYLELALSGGEDYELLFTAHKAIIDQVRGALDCPVTLIGDIVKEGLANRVTLMDSKGNVVRYEKGGWEHFREYNGAKIP
jgi:thiamine-monophosphate kinase